MTRRERRRARARLRDLYLHGVDTARDGAGIAPKPARPRAFREMQPRAVHATKTSVALRLRQELQVMSGMNGSAPWRPKGKRRVRYTTTVCWNGSRAAGADNRQTDGQYHGVKILPPGK